MPGETCIFCGEDAPPCNRWFLSKPVTGPCHLGCAMSALWVMEGKETI